MAAPRARADAPPWFTLLPDARVVAGEPGAVTAVCYDSRRVVPGALFVAVPGFETDGHRYLGDAFQRGATAFVVQADREALWEPLSTTSDLAMVVVPDTRRALARVAAAFYGEPARQLGVIGVTGTDGKTTTVHLTSCVLSAGWHSVPEVAGLVSSVGISTDGFLVEPHDRHVTTPEAPEVQKALWSMLENAVSYAVLEASSHGLALHRLDECDFDVAVFTTLTSDHLDFHGTWEEYRAAKGRLFQMLDESTMPKRTLGQFSKDVRKTAIINADDPASEYFRTLTKAPVLTYGVENDADVRATGIRMTSEGVRFKLQTRDHRRVGVATNLFGLYNVYNCLAAIAVGLSQDFDMDALADGLRDFGGVPGRMEFIDAGQPFRVVVDFASTPQALRRVLDTLRPMTEGKLIAVFGCAGERDPGRRDGMGRAAGELADFAVLTNEDPRREDPDAIIEQIAAALRAAGREEGRDFVRVPDRREALRSAFERATAGDTVLLAGKGTEPSIVFGTAHVPWDERAVARELLAELGP